jgi:hypothetical protein
MMCKLLILSVLIGIILVTLGCGQDSLEEVPEEGIEPAQSAAGRVTVIVNHTALINGVRADRNTPISKQDIISTDDGGQFLYEIFSAVNCRMLHNSSLMVYPTERTVFRVDKGSTYCSIAPSTVSEEFEAGMVLDAGDVRVSIKGTVFGLIVEEDQTTVKVASGFAEVQSLVTRSRVAVQVESGQQATVPRGMDPRQPEPITIDENEAEIFQQLEGLSEDEPLPLTPSAGPAGGRITFECNDGRSCAMHSQPVQEDTRIPTIKYYMYITSITK